MTASTPPTNYRELCRRLHVAYDSGEARAIVRWVLEERFGLSMADILCDKVTELSADDRTELEKIMLRLENGEPVQYVLGVAEFCSRKFRVSPAVLIPRPETEELCRWIIEEGGTRFEEGGRRNEEGYSNSRNEERDSRNEEGVSGSEECGVRILDIGTGSGCIAVTLAAELPQAQVSAWDISEEALAVARKNADFIGVNVDFKHVDVLNLQFTINNLQLHPSSIDIIVSNPPYVCENEKITMKPQVFAHEPSVALFVPDDDPLRFYRAISDFAFHALKPDGWLYFEVNPLYINELKTMLLQKGFDNIEEKCDTFGKKRMVRAKKSKK